MLRRGSAATVLQGLLTECGADTVHVTRRYAPWAVEQERTLAAAFETQQIEFRRFRGSLLLEPEDIATNEGRPYRVFTSFYKACLERLPSSPSSPLPDRFPAPHGMPESDTLENWALHPRQPDWASGLRDAWSPGETGAQAQLRTFIGEAMGTYDTQRDRPGRQGTSRLSPHLHFGEISPWRCWRTVQHVLAENGHRDEAGGTAFLRELIWREFSHHLLFHWPTLPDAPFRPDFARFPWQENEEHLAAWQRGRTGYPIVDAGMRQLWHTGWMHNRVRMVVASFLVKHLLIPWQSGAAWFWDTLVDADLANNSASWQWVAGCGADAAPYFRIFNPMTQGKKFDPDGAYVRQWVPELAALPAPHIHEPWSARAGVLKAAGVVLGETYPQPMVDHMTARQRALAAFKQLKA